MESNEWNEIPVKGKGSREDRVADEIPDGEYEGEIVEWSCFQAKDGRWWISWWVLITVGLRKGAQIQRFSEVSDRTAGFVKADLLLVTGRIPKWDGDLVDVERGLSGPVRQEIVGAVVSVRQKSRTYQGTIYRDVFLNKLLQGASSSSEEQEDDTQDIIPEDRWAAADRLEEERTEKPPQSPQEPSEAAGEGWGDPDCVSCRGAGCEACTAF